MTIIKLNNNKNNKEEFIFIYEYLSRNNKIINAME